MISPHIPAIYLKHTFPGSEIAGLKSSEREKNRLTFGWNSFIFLILKTVRLPVGTAMLSGARIPFKGGRREESNHKDQNPHLTSNFLRLPVYGLKKLGGKLSEKKYKVFLAPHYFTEDGTYYVVHRPIKRASGITHTHKDVKFSKEKALADGYSEVTGDEKSLILEKSRKEKVKTDIKMVNSLNERVWVSPEEEIRLLFNPKADTHYEFLYLGKPMEWLMENEQVGDFEQMEKTSRKYGGEQGYLGRVELIEALQKEELNPAVRFRLEHFLNVALFDSGFKIKLHMDEKESPEEKKSSGFRLIEKGKPGRPRKEVTA